MPLASIKNLAILFLLCFVSLLSGHTVFYQESFNINNGWTFDQNWSLRFGRLQLYPSSTMTNYDYSATSPNIALPANVTELEINMFIDEDPDHINQPDYFEIAIMADNNPNVIWTYSDNQDWGLIGGTNLYLSLIPFAGQTVQIRFRAHGYYSQYFNWWNIFDIKGYIGLPYDLTVPSVTYDPTPSAEVSTTCVVSVKNVGTMPVQAGSYIVKLMRSYNIEIASVPGVDLAPLETHPFSIEWTPTETGLTNIRARIFSSSDNTVICNSPTYYISVMPAGTISITVADGIEEFELPMSFIDETSLYECIYYASEITAPGMIYAIDFYNYFEENIGLKPTKIWLGTTTLQDLSSGWIPANQLSLVFSGNVNYPMGINMIPIVLANPYPYMGGNLVMMVQRPLDVYDYVMTDNDFYCLDTGVNRARLALSSTSIDPNNITNPIVNEIIPYLPKTTFIKSIFYFGTLEGKVTSEGIPLEGATVTAWFLSETTDASGRYFMLSVPDAVETVTCTATDHVTSTITDVDIQYDQITNLNIKLTPLTHYYDGFDTYPLYVTSFEPWVTIDVDQSRTKSIQGYGDFPGESSPMSFIVFGQMLCPSHSGGKMVACWSAPLPPFGNGPNNDWLISRIYNNVTSNAEVSFWARSLTDQYGLERFKVGISTGGTEPTDFTIISGPRFVQAPASWTQFTFRIPPSYTGQNLRIGIHCVSYDAYVFFVDEFVMNTNTANDDPLPLVSETVLTGNYPNPFSSDTIITYAVKRVSPVKVIIYNLKGQKVKTLVNETKLSGHHEVNWNGTDENNIKVTSGVYFYQMIAGNHTSTRKMILLK